MAISERTHYTMEEVAQRTGMTPRTLRYYEQLGLLEPTDRTEGGHRLYRDRDIERLESIKELKELLGYSLADMHEAMRTMGLLHSLRDTYENDPDPAKRLASIEEAHTLLEKQLVEMESRLTRLQRLNERGREFARHLATERDALRTRIGKGE